MGDEQENKKPGTFRTRKSEIVSGITVVLSVPILTLAWNIWRDVQKNAHDRSEQHNKQIEAVINKCSTLVDIERSRAQEQERDIKADLREIRTQVLTIRGRR